MSDFVKWLDYVSKHEDINFLSKRALVEMAFNAGVEFGSYQGMKFVAECEGLDCCDTGPAWYASKD